MEIKHSELENMNNNENKEMIENEKNNDNNNNNNEIVLEPERIELTVPIQYFLSNQTNNYIIQYNGFTLQLPISSQITNGYEFKFPKCGKTKDQQQTELIIRIRRYYEIIDLINLRKTLLFKKNEHEGKITTYELILPSGNKINLQFIIKEGLIQRLEGEGLSNGNQKGYIDIYCQLI